MQDEKQVVFEKGKVSEYNGQKDIYCDFVTVTQGNQKVVYYILNDKKLDNDLYIASTDLKEAIDPQILRTHLGIVDSKGNVVIPFENKILKEVENKYLLAVRNEAKTKSVVDAVASRNDPTAAERMVNTNASVKDKLNIEMQNQGRFLLNDLLSEGTVYTLDGKNMFDNQYYSFIGMTDNSFYCSTNVLESKVVKVPRTDVFSVRPNDVISEETVSDDSNSIDPVLPEVQPDEVKQDMLDVSDVFVQREKIDEALSSSTRVEEKNSVLDSLESKEVQEQEEVESDLEFELPPVSIDKINNELPDNKVDIGDSEGKQETFNVVDEKQETVNDNSTFSDSSISYKESPDEKFVNVVSAVSEIVQQNKDLEQQNKQLLDKISKLEHENESYRNQSQESSKLRDENLKLTTENEKLTLVNNGLRNAMNQISQELGISSTASATQNYGYQKVA